MNIFQRYLAEEFAEDYEEGRLTRREALKLIASVTGSLAIAQTILAACTPPPEDISTTSPLPSTSDTTLPGQPASPTSLATEPPTPTLTSATSTPEATPESANETLIPDDSQIEAGMVEFPGEGATIMAYLARPAGDGPFPVILVCHENRGLNDHIQDVARRFAQVGYVALAVDLLSRQGGTAAVGSGNVPGVLGNTPPDQFVQDFVSGWQYLQTQPFALADQVGMVGFCFGGGVTWRVATQMPALRAAVPFYGPHPPLEDVPNIQAPVLAFYGELDQRINQGIPAIEAAMEENGKIYEQVIYPNADHAFHNDTGSRYNPEAAQDAWMRTLAWFEKYLSRP